MPDPTVPDYRDKEVVREEVVRPPEDVREREVVHRDVVRPSEEVTEREVVRRETVPSAEQDREMVHREVVHEEAGHPVRPVAESGMVHDEASHTYQDPWEYMTAWLGTLGLWVGVILAVAEAFLAFRLLFLMSAANPGAGFVNFVYASTGWMVSPFQGITASGQLANGGLFESATLFAMIVYLVIALIIMAVFRTAARSPGGRHSVARREERHTRTY